MNEFGVKADKADLKESIGIEYTGDIYWNLSPAELVEETVNNGLGQLTDTGALSIETGEFTGRSPQDRFIVCDDKTENTVWWGNINKKFDAAKFDALYNRMKAYLNGRDLYVRDAYACAHDDYRLNLRVVTELPWSNMFAYNMFLRPTEEEIKNFNIEEQKEPKSRKRVKQNKEPLSLRKDVIYKTLIRSLKRYLTEKCDLVIDGCWTK